MFVYVCVRNAGLLKWNWQLLLRRCRSYRILSILTSPTRSHICSKTFRSSSECYKDHYNRVICFCYCLLLVCLYVYIYTCTYMYMYLTPMISLVKSGVHEFIYLYVCMYVCMYVCLISIAQAESISLSLCMYYSMYVFIFLNYSLTSISAIIG